MEPVRRYANHTFEDGRAEWEEYSRVCGNPPQPSELFCRRLRSASVIADESYKFPPSTTVVGRVNGSVPSAVAIVATLPSHTIFGVVMTRHVTVMTPTS